MKMKRFVLNAIGIFVTLVLMQSCGGGKTAPKEQKSKEQISRDYHNKLSTPDLSLFELCGNVESVVYPEGWLSQYLPNVEPKKDSITFAPNGLCEIDMSLRGDSLFEMRNTLGNISILSGKNEQSPSLRFAYNDDNQVTSWEVKNTEGEGSYVINYQDGKAYRVDGPSMQITIKVVKSDSLGNWTERELTKNINGSSQKAIQTRRIVYY